MEKEPENPLLPVLVSTQTIEPKPPSGFSPEAIQKVTEEVMAIAATASQQLENRAWITSLEGLGRADQDIASQKIEFVETKVNKLGGMAEKTDVDIPSIVTNMRQAIDKLNPQKARQSWLGRFLESIPGGKPILALWWASGLRQITMQRETVRQQIKGIRQGLLGNRDQLKQDNGELETVYSFIADTTLANLQRSAFAGELLWEQLQKMQNVLPPDDPRHARLRRAIEIVVVRIRSMRLIETALQQSLATTDIAIDGNNKLAESLDETANLTTSYLTVAMSLYQALARQKEAIKALVKAREGTADVMVETSRMAQQSATDVSEQYFNPSSQLAKVEEAHHNLMGALQTLEDASRSGLSEARQSIGKLRSMTDELREKQDELRGARTLTEPSSH
jgi:uncharacterized protein YaaN involved in tellurite resistance